MRVRKMSEARPGAFRAGGLVLKPLLFAMSSRTWIDGTKIPATGGVMIVINHISHMDPVTTAHFVYDHGRIPRIMAKASLFKNRVLGSYLAAAGMIPVERGGQKAAGAFDAAKASIDGGRCVVFYPEGTLTRDPDLWPMEGKSGAARIALSTGCPVIPVGQWGIQAILPPYAKTPKFFPRKHITLKAGDPVDLDDLRARPMTAATVAEATDRIMSAISTLVADVRGEPAPAVRFDPRKAGGHQTGNPNRGRNRWPNRGPNPKARRQQ